MPGFHGSGHDPSVGRSVTCNKVVLRRCASCCLQLFAYYLRLRVVVLNPLSMFLKAAIFSASVFALASGSCNCSRNDMPADDMPARVIHPLPYTYRTEESLPKAFDWRNVDGTNYITPVLNQHAPRYCGSCWLHAGVGVLNDRLKIARKAQWPEVMLARQVVLNCGGEIAGSCDGGTDYGVFVYASLYGIPDDSCQGYIAKEQECTDIHKCINCDPPRVGAPCYPVQRYGKYYVEEYGKMENPTVHQMKAEIFTRGPISCAITSTLIEGDGTPRTNIVSAKNEEEETDHDVVIVGWAVDPDIGEYWIVKNSWGTFWGDNGYFYVKSGVNALSIETECAWATIEAEPRVADYGPKDWDRVFRSALKPKTPECDLITV
ncbi:hypothetical protein FOZ61_001912 [Perkinsus olseni]|uniref:Peptidase C1A papain C-terminal domain-containing protein n=1 Tax=Perkinsus olseni TaxID=32597 RepID=A0A7J6MER1_PEROL|nr:hypothetical protein FOZ61_001912 [Perkinsus olseni]KAF4671557.1 hypothetical protein FOL46_000238 [Perkinsus olseni]